MDPSLAELLRLLRCQIRGKLRHRLLLRHRIERALPAPSVGLGSGLADLHLQHRALELRRELAGLDAVVGHNFGTHLACRALDVLAQGGLVPPLRLVQPVAPPEIESA